MNSDLIEGNWKQLKGGIQEKWGKLTDNELEIIKGNRNRLVGRIQELYGKSRDEAEKEVEIFENNIYEDDR